MAVTFHPDAGVDRTANGGYTVFPENVILKPELSGRSEETDITELAEDILHRKQLVPAICYKSQEGWPVLIAGHRRLRAIAELNKSLPQEKRIRLKFNYAEVKTDEAALDITVAENRNRTDTNVLDDSYNISVYSEKFGRGIEEIAKKYFPGADSPEKLEKAINWVKDRQKLLQLSTEAQEQLRKGEFSTSAAMQLTKLQPVDQNKLLKNKAEKGEKVKVKDVKEALDSSKPARKISDNSPIKLLKKHQILSELGCSLAAEVISEDPDWEVLMELARTAIVMGRKLNVPLLPNANKYAENNMDLHTPLDAEEKREMTLA